MPKFRKCNKTLDKVELVCTKTDGTKYDFNCFALSLKFIGKIHNYKIMLDEAIEDQTKLKMLINKVNNDYNPRTSKKMDEKNRVLESARKFLMREMILLIFLKKEFFHIKIMYLKQKKKKNRKNNQKKNQKKNKKKTEPKHLSKAARGFGTKTTNTKSNA